MRRGSRSEAIDAGLLMQVLAVDVHACGLPVILTDTRLDTARIVWSGARLVSRRSRCRTRRVLLVRRPSRVDITQTNDVVIAYLPKDIRMGDVLALPSRTAASYAARGTQLT